MSDIIAGDPAPTNPTAAIRADILAGLRAAESGSIGDETPEELLDRYDALKRAEVLAERDAELLCSALNLGEGSGAFIADYDARKRAEVLAEAAEFFEGVLKEALHPEKDARYWSAVHDMVHGLRNQAAGGAR